MPVDRSDQLGRGDVDERLRVVERFVSDHEGDLTAFRREVDALFKSRGAAAAERHDLKLKVGQHEVIISEIGDDVKELKVEFKEMRTSLRTVAVAVFSAAVAFTGLAVVIATQVRPG